MASILFGAIVGFSVGSLLLNGLWQKQIRDRAADRLNLSTRYGSYRVTCADEF